MHILRDSRTNESVGDAKPGDSHLLPWPSSGATTLRDKHAIHVNRDSVVEFRYALDFKKDREHLRGTRNRHHGQRDGRITDSHGRGRGPTEPVIRILKRHRPCPLRKEPNTRIGHCAGRSPLGCTRSMDVDHIRSIRGRLCL